MMSASAVPTDSRDVLIVQRLNSVTAIVNAMLGLVLVLVLVCIRIN